MTSTGKTSTPSSDLELTWNLKDVSTMYIKNPQKRRPYWHVDAKWISGLLLSAALGAALLVFNLVQITAEEPAVEILTLSLASMFNPEGLDQSGDIDTLLKALADSPNGSVKPVKELDIVVWEKDVDGKSPREIRNWFFRQWALPLYHEGPDGLAKLAEDPEMRADIRAGLGPLGWINAQTHQRLQRVFQTTGALSLVLLGILLAFSHRFGRLGSPGTVVLVASLPGVLLFTILNSPLGKLSTTYPGGEDGLWAMLADLVANALPVVMPILLHNYMIFMAVGLGLMLLATLGHLITVPEQGGQVRL